MNQILLLQLMALSCVQVLLYRTSPRKVLDYFFPIWCFYTLAFAAAQAVWLLCGVAKIQFYYFPLLSIILFLLFSSHGDWLPSFDKKLPGLPPFYLTTAVWWPLAGYSIFEPSASFLTAPFYFAEGALWSVLAVSFLLVMSGIKERLELADLPKGLPEDAILVLSAGFLSAAFSFF